MTLGRLSRDDAALQAIVGRITDRFDTLGEKMARRYRAEIIDYLTLENKVLYGDVIAISLENLKALISNLERGEIVGPKELDDFRESAARRVHQGVSLESLLHAYRLWGQIVWETILEVLSTDSRDELEEALWIAGRIMEHIDLVSTAVAQAYLDEAQGVWSDREVVRRDLLEALISGKGNSDAVKARAQSLHLDLAPNYVVLLARTREGMPEASAGLPPPGRDPMRRTVDSMKSHLRPNDGFLLVGLRHDEVVALYPVAAPESVDRLREQSLNLAADVGLLGFAVGIGGWHPGAEGIAASYSEAKDAVEIAIETESFGRPLQFDDVVLDHALRSNPKSEQLLSATLEPLREYDARHGRQLIPTLQAYMAAGFNMTKAASALCIHPNTVVYRLRRVKALTGRDPHDFSDLLLLCLSLKVGGVSPP